MWSEFVEYVKANLTWQSFPKLFLKAIIFLVLAIVLPTPILVVVIGGWWSLNRMTKRE